MALADGKTYSTTPYIRSSDMTTPTGEWDILEGDSRVVPNDLPHFDLILTDPPFGTGKRQEQRGFSYLDSKDATAGTLQILRRWGKHLNINWTMAVICDYRLSNDIVNALNFLSFRGEIIWTFGLGRPRQSWWPNRHNNILTFTHTTTSGYFDASAIPRERRKAPSAKYSGDKPAGSVWDYTMNNTSSERVGYPNQKPLTILRPFILAHTLHGELVADPFVGSGSTGVAAITEGRRFLGVDNNADAVRIAINRMRRL